RSRRGCPLEVCDERVAGVGRTWSRPPRRRGASGTGSGDRRRHGCVGRLLPAGGQRPVSGPDLGGEGRHGPAGARSRRRAAGAAAHRGGGEALRAARAMASLAPASEALYLVAEDAMALNRPREAVAALVALGPDRGFTRGWWVYWYDLTTALHLLGDHRAELKQALEGAR